jgi:triosephosphate isomerase
MATQEEKNWRNKYRVGRTFIPEHKLLVSTVLLAYSERRSREYETMVFHADGTPRKLNINFSDLLCMRSDSRREARANHKRVVEQLRLGWFYREPESADAWQVGQVVLIGAN